MHIYVYHDDVNKWRHFPRYWSFVRGPHRSPVNSPHKDQYRGTLMFSLICACINGWENNRKAGDLRRHRTHLDVIVMFYLILVVYSISICCVSPSLYTVTLYCTLCTYLLPHTSLSTCVLFSKTNSDEYYLILPCVLPNDRSYVIDSKCILETVLWDFTASLYAVFRPQIYVYTDFVHIFFARILLAYTSLRLILSV